MADLQEKIQAELDNIAAVVAQLPPSDSLAKLSQLELAGISAFLHSFYNGVENVLKQKLMALAVDVPTGASWHRDLLNLCTEKGIISGDSRSCLAPYLAFRHFFSHSYAVDLDPEKLAALVEKIGEAHKQLKADIAGAFDSRPETT